jgi:DinB family protein
MSNQLNLVSGLSELATQVRSITVRQVGSADPALLPWTPPGLSNHMLWHAGHALWVGDVLTVEPVTGRSELPAGWEAVFGEGSRPASQTNWPDVADVLTLLERQLDRVLTIFREQAASIERRAGEMSPNCGWPLLAGIIHGWHDEARHQGEMHLLAKLYRGRSRPPSE